MTHTKTGMFKSWSGVQIRQLSNNDVYVPEDDEMAIITVHFVGNERPRDFVFALDGREIDHMEVSTGSTQERFIRARGYVESCEVLD